MLHRRINSLAFDRNERKGLSVDDPSLYVIIARKDKPEYFVEPAEYDTKEIGNLDEVKLVDFGECKYFQNQFVLLSHWCGGMIQHSEHSSF